MALNVLNSGPESAHAADAAAPPVRFVFVVREGTAYRLRPEADLWVDAAEFAQRCERGLNGPADEGAIAERERDCGSTPAITCPKPSTKTGLPMSVSGR